MSVSQAEKVTLSVSQASDPPKRRGSQPLAAEGPRLVVSNEVTDAYLAQRAVAGERSAFQTLVEAHIGRIVSVARRLLGNDSDADDLAQETFVRFWNRLGELDIGEAGAGPWLRRVAFNLCMDRKRSARDFVPDALELLASDDDQHRRLEEDELSTRVEAALQGLPDRQRAALVLFHFEGYTVKEIAETMDVSADAVESLLGRARRSLKAALADEWQALLPEGRDSGEGPDVLSAEDN